MRELSYITPLIIALVFLGLALLAFLYHRQKQRLQHQRRQLREQNFALKKTRIINEIAARLGASNAPLPMAAPPAAPPDREAPLPDVCIPNNRPLTPPAPEKRPGEASADRPEEKRPYLRTMQPIAGNQQGTARGGARQGVEDGAIEQKIEHGLDQGVEHGRGNQKAAKPPPDPAPAARSVTARESDKPRQIARRIEAAKGPIITYPKRIREEAATNRERGSPLKPVTDFHLNLSAGLYEQIASYSSWIAGQSEHFTIAPKGAGDEAERFYLLLTPGDLERRNGHWFDLFQPPDFSEITKLAEQKGGLFCPFDEHALDNIITPARQIIALAKEDGSSRYRQVLRESALEEFVSFLEEVRGEIAPQEA